MTIISVDTTYPECEMSALTLTLSVNGFLSGQKTRITKPKQDDNLAEIFRLYFVSEAFDYFPKTKHLQHKQFCHTSNEFRDDK